MPPCVVCDERDRRALLDVKLTDGTKVSLCGTHELMHRRMGKPFTSAAELRRELGDRRGTDRRATGAEEIDELAARLQSAFTLDRRGPDRRMN